MKRLAVLLAHFPSLTEMFVVRELAELERRGHRIAVFAFRRGRGEAVRELRERFSKVTVFRPLLLAPRLLAANLYFLFTRPRRYIAALFMLIAGSLGHPVVLAKTLRNFPGAVYFARRMQELEIEHLHAHFAFIPAALAAAIGVLLELDFSFSAHAWDIYVDRTMLPEKMRRARFIVTCTEHNRRHLAAVSSGRFSEKVFRIYHGLDLEVWRRKEAMPRAPGARLEILSVGRLVPKKGFPYLIAACRALTERGCAFRCVIAGEGRERTRLEASIRAYGLGDTVQLIGAATMGQLPPLSEIGMHFPAAGRPADLAYKVSLQAVLDLDERLEDRGGWRALIAQTRRLGRFDEAFLDLTGMPLNVYYREFHEDLKGSYGWFAVFASPMNVYMAMTLLFLLGLIRIYIRNRRRLAAMEDDLE